MKKLLLLSLCTLLAMGMRAQQVKGYVRDAQTDETLPGVNITYRYRGDTKGTATDINGYYQIDVPADAISLSFSYIGYITEDCPLVVSGKSEIVQNINLKPETKLLDEVVVSVGRYEQKLSDITVSMEVIKPADIARQSPTDLRAVLTTIPGVDVTDKQPSIRSGSGWTYGVGSRSQVMVDGMSVLTPGVGEINWNIIPLENIDQVEVIKGASSVLYGSSALNGLINVRTRRPRLDPETNVSLYMGIYGDPKDYNGEDTWQWWDKSFWKEGKYPVEPGLRRSLLSGVRNPLYNGVDVSHSRRIGNFDVTGSLNMFTDEGYRKGGYNKRVRAGGNLTYHHPTIKTLNYGFNMNAMTNEYGDFFIWHSPERAYEESPIANMGREHNMFYIDPFLNYYNDKNKTSHKIRGRFYTKTDNIIRKNNGESLVGIMRNMGVDGEAVNNILEVVENPTPVLAEIMLPLLKNDLDGTVNAITGIANRLLPGAERGDYVDLISWLIRNPLPQDTNDLLPWAMNALEPAPTKTDLDNTSSYFLDYQFGKQFSEISTLTTGVTYEHVGTRSAVTGNHKSDNIALFAQYDHKLFDRLNLSLGMRFEYYRVDEHKREAETDIFGMQVPFKPVFRGGLNYQLADYTFLRASFGQGYRYPSLTEKFIVKDIGGVGAYPNSKLKPESGYNAELGIKQAYKLGPFMGYIDLAGFFSYYKDMIEFDFGLINPDEKLDYPFITDLSDVLGMLMQDPMQLPAIGVKFSNVSRARIYGADLSINGLCKISPQMNLTYSLGYMYTMPEDVKADERNKEEEANTGMFAMKSKSNTSKYLKYRQKHTAKATIDFNWDRFSLGTNMMWKSKTLAVDYLMVDERPDNVDVMTYVRQFIFGDLNGYWKENNTGFFTMDLRAGVQVTKQVSLQFMVNNLLNNHYSIRPMDVSAPRTFVMKANMKF